MSSPQGIAHSETAAIEMVRRIAGAPSSTQLEPILVKPAAACRLLDCSMRRIYQLMERGDVEHFRDGRSRKITTESIRAYVERLRAGGKAA